MPRRQVQARSNSEPAVRASRPRSHWPSTTGAWRKARRHQVPLESGGRRVAAGSQTVTCVRIGAEWVVLRVEWLAVDTTEHAAFVLSQS